MLVQEELSGRYYRGAAEDLLSGPLGEELRGKVHLILTSPPFPLNNKKSYGNKQGSEYLAWFVNLAKVFSNLLADDGSIVVELGNAWESGRPVQSLLPLECLLGFAKHASAGLRLCQEFICYNPSRLPSPAEWVTVTRERATDSYTRVWWLAKTDRPKANNANVLREYSEAMQKLLQRKDFNRQPRPSGHHISTNGFLKDNSGSIAPNFFELEHLDPAREVRLPNTFGISGTTSNDRFSKECRRLGITPHPARMPIGLATYFIEFLTVPGDLVLDPFAGSNTTGFAAAVRRRRWVAIESRSEFETQSRIRFTDPSLQSNGTPAAYECAVEALPSSASG
jgi:DNA modification methylase